MLPASGSRHVRAGAWHHRRDLLSARPEAGGGRAVGAAKAAEEAPYLPLSRTRRSLQRQDSPLSTIPIVNAVLNAGSKFSQPIQRLIDRSGMNLTVGALLLMCLCGGVAGYLIVETVSHLPLAALVIGVPCAYIPIWFVNFMATRRVGKFEEQFPEAIDLLARALRAGHAFTTGLSMVAEEMPEPVGTEFRLAYDRQNFGMPMGGGAQVARRSCAAPRRAVLRHRRADAARGWWQPGRSAGQPGPGHSRPVQGEAAGAGHYRTRTHHRLGVGVAAAVPWRRADAPVAGTHGPALDRSRSGSRWWSSPSCCRWSERSLIRKLVNVEY